MPSKKQEACPHWRAYKRLRQNTARAVKRGAMTVEEREVELDRGYRDYQTALWQDGENARQLAAMSDIDRERSRYHQELSALIQAKRFDKLVDARERHRTRMRKL